MLAKDWPSLIVWLVLCLAAGFGSGWLTREGVNGWYQTRIKPPLTPPDWIFAPVWTALYILMAIAAWLVWSHREATAGGVPIILFLVQLGLNFFWSLIFFRWRQAGWAFFEIILLWLVIAGTLDAFSHISWIAGALLIPYLAWVSFATYLCGANWLINRGGPP